MIEQFAVNRPEQHLDHPPTPEELAAIYMGTESDDPRSLFYKRTLIRPKVPVWQWVGMLLLIVGVAVGAGLGAWALWQLAWVAVICGAVAAMLTVLLLAKPLLIASVKTYQALAPKAIRERCRYEPSCSVYMLLAVEKYGFWKGFRKGLKRWKGCKPPNGGIDPP